MSRHSCCSNRRLSDGHRAAKKARCPRCTSSFREEGTSRFSGTVDKFGQLLNPSSSRWRNGRDNCTSGRVAATKSSLSMSSVAWPVGKVFHSQGPHLRTTGTKNPDEESRAANRRPQPKLITCRSFDCSFASKFRIWFPKSKKSNHSEFFLIIASACTGLGRARCEVQRADEESQSCTALPGPRHLWTNRDPGSFIVKFVLSILI